MADWYDVSSPRKKKDGGTYWQKVGSAQKRDGDRWNVYFDALPLPEETGRCMVGIFPRRERGEEEAPF